jgi:hypothetical protein
VPEAKAVLLNPVELALLLVVEELAVPVVGAELAVPVVRAELAVLLDLVLEPQPVSIAAEIMAPTARLTVDVRARRGAFKRAALMVGTGRADSPGE